MRFDCILHSACFVGLYLFHTLELKDAWRNVLAGAPVPVKHCSGGSLHPSVLESCSKNREKENVSLLSLTNPKVQYAQKESLTETQQNQMINFSA